MARLRTQPPGGETAVGTGRRRAARRSPNARDLRLLARVSPCVSLAALVIVPSLPSLAQAGDAGPAREQLKIGFTLARDGKCDEAIPHFSESLRLDPKAITLINLADCEEKTGRLTQALARWVDARGRAQTESNRPIEEEAERRQKALEPRLPKLTIVLSPRSPPGAVVVRDGVTLGAVSLGVALPVDPGKHTVVVRLPGYADSAKDVSLAEAEATTIEVGPSSSRVAGSPAPEPGPSSSSVAMPLVYAGFGVAVLGVIVGGVTGAMALGKGSDADTACPDHRCRDAAALDDVDSGKTLGTVSTIAFVAAGIGIGVGTYGLLSRGRGTSKASRGPDVALFLGATSGLRGQF